MKRRWNIAVLVIAVMLGMLAWTLYRERQTPVSVATSNSKPDTLTIRVETVSRPLSAVENTDLTTESRRQSAANPSPVLSDAHATAPAETPVSAKASAPEPSSVKTTYTAQPGDTVSNLAAELPGGNRKVNRDAVINANASLQRDPDKVIAGKTYQLTGSAKEEPTVKPDAPTAKPVVAGSDTAVAAGPAEITHELKYIARKGDNVSTLAASLLGSDSKENRDAIIGANASLLSNPDRVVEGQTYRIPVRASQPLAAAPASAVLAAPRPTTQPDADTVVQNGSVRELRYTARDGDNVSTLANALLGSDTKENRDAIINGNESLKKDPNRVIAGQTYWIPAPAAAKPD